MPFLLERLISVHAAGNAQAGQNSRQNSYYRLNDKFPSIFFHLFFFLNFTQIFNKNPENPSA